VLEIFDEEQRNIEAMTREHNKKDRMYKGVEYYLGLGKLVEKELEKTDKDTEE
jgi:hypothetical protein